MSQVTLNPRESAKLIFQGSQNVRINLEGVDCLAKSLVSALNSDCRIMDTARWKSHPLNPKQSDDSAIEWIFLVDALNFSFWSMDERSRYSVNYGGITYTGYWSLCAAINRALDEGIPLTDARFYCQMSLEQAASIFRSDSDHEIPMLAERVAIMHEIGAILVKDFDGKFVNCVKKTGGNAQRLLDVIVNTFPCFKDEGIYQGRTVSFYKRAQILIADIWACFGGEGLGAFEDIDSITMFADYRIPQTLVHFNVLSYSEELNCLLRENYMFTSGDVMEMEIRAASIWAVELLVKRMGELIKEEGLGDLRVNAIMVDHYLWDFRRLHDEETKHIPFHKIRCIYY